MITALCELWVWPWIITERWRKMVWPELLRWLPRRAHTAGEWER
jgi:hypothetical protein